jgi:ribosomal protein L32
MLVQEIIDRAVPEWKASKELCRSPRSDSSLGASALSSCRSQGLRARKSKVKHTINKTRKKITGKKIKGKKYGGPLPDWS